MILSPDFKEFVQSLNDNGVRYLVVRGYAVALHGQFVECYRDRVVVMVDDVAVNFIDLENLRK